MHVLESHIDTQRATFAAHREAMEQRAFERRDDERAEQAGVVTLVALEEDGAS